MYLEYQIQFCSETISLFSFLEGMRKLWTDYAESLRYQTTVLETAELFINIIILLELFNPFAEISSFITEKFSELLCA